MIPFWMAADLKVEARHDGGGRVFHFRPVHFLLINMEKQLIYVTMYNMNNVQL